MKKTLMAAAAACVLIFSAIAPAPAQSKKALQVETGLVDAVALFDAGHFKEASSLLKVLANADPANDAVHYYYGMSAVGLRDYDTAVAQLREAVRLDPTNYWYRDRLARLYISTNQPELAIDIYESLIKENPKKTDIYYSLVQLYMQNGKTEDVLRTLDEIETVAGKDDMVALTKYDILMRQEKPDEAYALLESYNEELTSPRILVAMGDHCVSQFRDTLALKYYSEALSYEAGMPQALLGMSEIYRYRGDFPNYFATVTEFVREEETPLEMKTRYIQTLFQHADPQFARRFKPSLDLLVDTYRDQAPRDSSVLQTVASYYYNTADGDKAVDLMKECSELYPESIGSRGMYVQLLTLLERWDEAGPAAEQAFADFPQEPGFLEMKTYSDYNLKDFEGLIRDCERIIGATSPRDTSIRLRAYSGIGDAWHEIGDSQKAFAAYEKALKIDPHYLPVLNNYAYFLCLEGRKLKKAAAMSKITIEAEPDNATYLDTYGWILYLQGKAAEAKPYFKHAMLYGGKDSAAVLDHYAEVLYKLKEYDTARVYWNLAKNKNTDGAVPDLDERVEARLKAIE
ncbi:MAG: tetratricopeptide repeat protein [Bacteroidales bacterium]|nr:tetratricopeptide repeat protein [Bacteroidales bacterium]